jgi:hypothetical protein
LELYSWQQAISPASIDGLHEVSVVIQNTKTGKNIFELKTLLFEVPDESRTSSAARSRDSSSHRGRSRTR